MKFVATCLFLASMAFAQEENWVNRTGSHEGGFFRVGFPGIHPISSGETELPTGQKIQDNGSLFPIVRLQWGWSVMPRLALHASILDYVVNPDDDKTTMCWGPGLTWYTPKWNVFLTGTYGFSLIQISGTSNTGTRWWLGVGKEFQVSECNGLGLMLVWDHGSWEDSDLHEKWNMNGVGLQLTWTYN
jgi:hypothetical protein